MPGVVIDIVPDCQEQVGPRGRDRAPDPLRPVLLIAGSERDPGQRPARVERETGRRDAKRVVPRRVVRPKRIGRGARSRGRCRATGKQRQTEGERPSFHYQKATRTVPVIVRGADREKFGLPAASIAVLMLAI